MSRAISGWEADKRRKETREWLRQRQREIELRRQRGYALRHDSAEAGLAAVQDLLLRARLCSLLPFLDDLEPGSAA
jgi:hypothetical protein